MEPHTEATGPRNPFASKGPTSVEHTSRSSTSSAPDRNVPAISSNSRSSNLPQRQPESDSLTRDYEGINQVHAQTYHYQGDDMVGARLPREALERIYGPDASQNSIQPDPTVSPTRKALLEQQHKQQHQLRKAQKRMQAFDSSAHIARQNSPQGWSGEMAMRKPKREVHTSINK